MKLRKLRRRQVRLMGERPLVTVRLPLELIADLLGASRNEREAVIINALKIALREKAA